MFFPFNCQTSTISHLLLYPDHRQSLNFKTIYFHFQIQPPSLRLAQMATRTGGSKPGRQLGELLQEQQEPFILEVYLSERGCLRKSLNTTSGANFIGCHGNSGKFSRKFGSQNQGKKSVPHFPKVLKVILCNKFCTVKGLRTKNSDDEDGKVGVTEMYRDNQETAELDRFSSASSTTVYNSCSDNDIDELSMFADNFKSNFDEGENKAAADGKFQWRRIEDSKQHSPQSVLEDISSTSTGSTLDIKDSILSASLWDLLVQTTPKKSSYAGLTSVGGSTSAFSISKRVMRQTKQLLLDCVEETIEKKHEKEEKIRRGVLGCEENIGKVICKKMRGCADHEKNIREMLLDLTQEKEWDDFQTENRKHIGMVIGNAIVEEITSEVVMDMMIDDYCPIAYNI